MALYAISGCSSSGKTTLINSLHYSKINTQYARSLLKEFNWTIDDIVKSKRNIDYFHDQCLLLKQSNEQQYILFSTKYDEPVFTERSFLDIFIYYALYYKQYHNSNFINTLYNHFDKKSNDINSLVITHPYVNNEETLYYFLKKTIELDNIYYQKIFYLNSIPVIEDDHVRIVNTDFINQQHKLFNLLMSMIPSYKSKVIRIESDSLNERIHLIKKEILS